MVVPPQYTGWPGRLPVIGERQRRSRGEQPQIPRSPLRGLLGVTTCRYCWRRCAGDGPGAKRALLRRSHPRCYDQRFGGIAFRIAIKTPNDPFQ